MTEGYHSNNILLWSMVHGSRDVTCFWLLTFSLFCISEYCNFSDFLILASDFLKILLWGEMYETVGEFV